MKLTYDKLEELLDAPKLDRGKKNFVARCPYCGEREWGISIYTENHPFNCYRKKACGRTGNIFTLLSELGRLDEFTTPSLEITHKLISKLEESGEVNIDLNIPTISPPILWRRTFSDEYLDSRGFTEVEYNNYVVGTSKVDPRVGRNYVSFLVYQFGELKGYVGRHIWNKKRIELYNKRYFEENGIKNKIRRYSNSPGTDFSKLLYGYDEITSNTRLVILVEGIFDKIAIDRLLQLYGQEEIKCIATFKCHLSPEQSYLLQLKGITSLVLLYDGDVIKEIKKTATECQEFFNSVKVGFIKDKDPDEITVDELQEVLERLETPLEFMSNKVSKKILK